LSLELADGEEKSVAGMTTKERRSIGSTNAKKNSGLEPMTTEEVQLSLVLLATTKESVAGSTRKRTKESVAGTTMNERRASIGSTSRWKLGAPGKRPAEREGVGPLEQKECRNCRRCFHGRAWKRRSALESACGSPSVRRSQMWNGD